MILDKAQERKSDLRNTSVMEVIIAVILVLLVFVYNNEIEFLNSTATLTLENKELKDKVILLETTLKELKQKIRKLEKHIKSLEEDLKQYIELAEGAGVAQDRLQEAYDKLEKDFRKLERENKILRTTIKSLPGKGGNINQELLEQVLDLEQQVLSLQKDLETARDRIKTLEKEIGTDIIKKLRDEIKTLEEKLKESGKGKGGSDKPRCRFSFGNVDFLFEIRIIKDNYLIKFIPNKKITAGLIENADGMRAFSDAISGGNSISTGNFEKLAGTIYRWTQRQNPACRFRVKIWDSPDFDKWHSRRIQRYFYIREIY